MIPPDAQRAVNTYLREVLGPEVGQDLVAHWARRTPVGWVFGVATRGFADGGEGAVLAPVLVGPDGEVRPAPGFRPSGR